MFGRLILSATLLTLSAQEGWTEDLPKQNSEDPPSIIKVFSKDGIESLSAYCSPKNVRQERGMPTEVNCRFTNVRFQFASESGTKIPPSTLEAWVESDPKMADEFRRDPAKVRDEWTEQMEALKKDFCSADKLEKLRAKIGESAKAPKRKHLLNSLLQACVQENSYRSTFMQTLAQIQQSTCEVWVDHFSLDFSRIGEGQWLYTQKQPSQTGILKVYELSAEAGYSSLWTLRETRLTIGQEEAAETRPRDGSRVWKWNNFDNVEIPDRCHFMSHRLIQPDYGF